MPQHSYQLDMKQDKRGERDYVKKHSGDEVTQVMISWNTMAKVYQALAMDVVGGKETAKITIATEPEYEEAVSKAQEWMANNPEGVRPEATSSRFDREPQPYSTFSDYNLL